MGVREISRVPSDLRLQIYCLLHCEDLVRLMPVLIDVVGKELVSLQRNVLALVLTTIPDFNPTMDSPEHPRLRRPEKDFHILRVSKPQRSLLIPNEVQGVIGRIVIDKGPSPANIQLRDDVLDSVLGDVPVQQVRIDVEVSVSLPRVMALKSSVMNSDN